MSTGLFIVFEGGDGVGKSTQAEMLAAWLRSEDVGEKSVLETREPGGTALGREVRQAVMHGDHVAPRAEALLYAADRAHHIATKVRPALDRGEIVVQDRYVDSSVVYQGGARGLGDEVERISRWATENLLPDLIVVLDAAVAPDRLARELDRVERETVEHAEAIRTAFLDRAALDPQRYVIIDGHGTVDEVHARVRAAVEPLLKAKRP